MDLLYAKPLLPDTTDWFMLLFMAFVICLMAVSGICLSEISDRAGVGSVFRSILCGGNVILYLPDKNSAGRSIPGMAGVHLCMGM